MDIYQYASKAGQSNTQRAYGADWKHFEAWCEKKKKTPLPANADDVASYLRFCAEKLHLKLTTVARRAASISEVHKRNRHEPPTTEWVVRNTLKRLRRELGRPVKVKKPLLVENLKSMLTLCPPTLTGKRDKAVMLTCFAGAFKRSELVSLNTDDIALSEEGLLISVSGRKTGIPYGKHKDSCPVTALLDWLGASRISIGPLFRAMTKNDRPRMGRMSDRIVAEIVKKYSALIGQKSDLFSGHSLRAGLVVSAAIAGASESSIQKQTGHKSLLVLRRYTKDVSLFQENVVGRLDL